MEEKNELMSQEDHWRLITHVAEEQGIPPCEDSEHHLSLKQSMIVCTLSQFVRRPPTRLPQQDGRKLRGYLDESVIYIHVCLPRMSGQMGGRAAMCGLTMTTGHLDLSNGNDI